ncbi:MAG: hypothetical protein IJP17_07040 [Clostridia bacterium]|nr:hypothetical protein [Clostridia bacterium]
MKNKSALMWILLAATAVIVLAVFAMAVTQNDFDERHLLTRPDAQQVIGGHYVTPTDAVSAADVVSAADTVSSADTASLVQEG